MHTHTHKKVHIPQYTYEILVLLDRLGLDLNLKFEWPHFQLDWLITNAKSNGKVGISWYTSWPGFAWLEIYDLAYMAQNDHFFFFLFWFLLLFHLIDRNYIRKEWKLEIFCHVGIWVPFIFVFYSFLCCQMELWYYYYYYCFSCCVSFGYSPWLIYHVVLLLPLNSFFILGWYNYHFSVPSQIHNPFTGKYEFKHPWHMSHTLAPNHLNVV